MKDVTIELLSFKEAIRHVWNSAFLANIRDPSLDDVADFQDLAKRLFAALVIRKLGLQLTRNDYGEGLCFDIVVLHATGLTEIPVLRNKASERRGSWQHVKTPLQEFGTPNFIEFFNWGDFGFVDFPYVRCSSEANKCQYLVEQHNCRFAILDDEIDKT